MERPKLLHKTPPYTPYYYILALIIISIVFIYLVEFMVMEEYGVY